MNEFTVMFCIAPLVVGVGLPFLYVVGYLHNIIAKAAQEDAKAQARERALRIREAKACHDAQLHEAKLAAEHNKVVLQDAKLELELLKIKEQKFKTRHMREVPFEPVGYE